MSKFRFEIKVSFAILLSAMGMIGLALLNVTQWARVNISVSNSLLQFLLGISPNVAAGYAMPLILASFVPKVVKNTNKGESRNFFSFVSIFTTLGLIVWELFKSIARIFILTSTILSQPLLVFHWHFSCICGFLK